MYSGFLDSFQALSELLTFKILPPRYFSYPKSAFCQCSISNLEKQLNVFLLFFISTNDVKFSGISKLKVTMIFKISSLKFYF